MGNKNLVIALIVSGIIVFAWFLIMPLINPQEEPDPLGPKTSEQETQTEDGESTEKEISTITRRNKVLDEGNKEQKIKFDTGNYIVELTTLDGAIDDLRFKKYPDPDSGVYPSAVYKYVPKSITTERFIQILSQIENDADSDYMNQAYKKDESGYYVLIESRTFNYDKVGEILNSIGFFDL